MSQRRLDAGTASEPDFSQRWGIVVRFLEIYLWNVDRQMYVLDRHVHVPVVEVNKPNPLSAQHDHSRL